MPVPDVNEVSLEVPSPSPVNENVLFLLLSAFAVNCTKNGLGSSSGVSCSATICGCPVLPAGALASNSLVCSTSKLKPSSGSVRVMV
ncbi:hypothetical protein FQZ97_958600 [compost metagenome]